MTRSLTASESTKRLTTISTSVFSRQQTKTFTQKKSIAIDDLEEKTREKPPLYNTQCNYSLYIFSKENKFRIAGWKIVSSKYFEIALIVFILLSTVLLIVNTYYLRESTKTADLILSSINIFFVCIFAIECVFKIVVYGFFFDKGSYLRDTWNVLDFIIAVIGVMDASLSFINIPMIRVLRLLRTLRPLRFMSHNKDMRILVKAVLKSMGALLNTIILILIVYIMFSIVGVNFFAGKFQYCSEDLFVHGTRDSCEASGAEWLTYNLNFDNVINGLMVLFQYTTQENWPLTVYQAIDCTEADRGPIMEYSWYYSYYFVIFLFVGSMFLLNLFVGVLSYNFNKVQKQEYATFDNVLATETQLQWIEIQKLIVKAEPNYNVRTAPNKHSKRAIIHKIITNFYFELIISFVILLNMIVMAIKYEGEPLWYENMLVIFNYVFTGIFTVEIILKLIGYGCDFWYDAWNLFDFIVVLCSYVDLILSNILTSSLKLLSTAPQLLRLLRVFRLVRLFRLVRKYQRLQSIMEIIQLSLPSILNVFVLLTLVFLIYAVLGCYLFYEIEEGEAINDMFNFHNFGFAFLLNLRVVTGEDWEEFMFDCAGIDNCVAGVGCGNASAYIYFITNQVVITFVMLNLFVLVVLQLFEKYFITEDNTLSTFKEDLELFQEKWLEAKPTHLGFFIHVDKLRKFFKSLPPSFGFEGDDPNRLISQIIALGIRTYTHK